MPGVNPETGDAGPDSVSVGALQPGSGSPLPLPPVGPVPAENFNQGDGGKLDAPSETPTINPHNWPLLAEAPVGSEPPDIQSSAPVDIPPADEGGEESLGVPGDTGGGIGGPGDGYDKAIHVEDDRI